MKNNHTNDQKLILLDDSELRDISGGTELLDGAQPLSNSVFFQNPLFSPEALEERAKNRNTSLLEQYSPTDTSSAGQAVELKTLPNVGIAILNKQP